MSQPKHRGKHIGRPIHKFASSFASSLTWGTRGSREFDGLFDSQTGEVNIIFRAVLNISPIMTEQFVGGE